MSQLVGSGARLSNSALLQVRRAETVATGGCCFSRNGAGSKGRILSVKQCP
jgi:hypothetical protein